MSSTAPHMLVIGSAADRDELQRLLPRCPVQHASLPLEGVWQAGGHDFGGVFVSLSAGSRCVRAVQTLRRILDGVRIIVGCEPADEPEARRLLEEGADDYVLFPLDREDLEHAFQLPAQDVTEAEGPTPLPSLEEVTRLAEILKTMDAGVVETFDRFAALIRDAFDARGLTVQLDDLAREVGDAREPVIEQAIERDGRTVGRIALARRRSGSYPATAAVRLGDYARLLEVVMRAASERDRWRELAWTDDLSGLRNRRFFDRRFDELLERATREHLRLTVLLFDIDDFKSYNDTYGHETGDQLLREVSELLIRCTREQDVVARFGGDEFAVIFWDAESRRIPGSEHPREPVALAERFCHTIFVHDFQCLGKRAPGPVTISGGLACFPWNGTTRAELLKAADDALLEAKRTGKNRIQLSGGNAKTATPPEES